MTDFERLDRRRPRRAAIVAIAFPVVLAGAVASACGTTDKASREPLPPIRTTTSTTTIPGSTIPEGRVFYEVKSGDTLGRIAASFSVPMEAIIELNKIENPDNVPAGVTIEIPTGVVLVSELPEPTTTG